MKLLIIITLMLFAVLTCFAHQSKEQENPLPSFQQYIKKKCPAKKEIDVFLKDSFTWTKFDTVTGYVLNNYMIHNGINNSFTISTTQQNGARTSFMYANKPCRINTYGDSFTECHQVSDGETWQEQLAAHLGEPIRNFGMGGYGVYEAYRRMLIKEDTKDSAQYIIFYIWGNDHMRGLFRCRQMAFREYLEMENEVDGIGKRFEGNFWASLEMDLNTGKFAEYDSRISRKQDLYKMTDPDWMWENLKTDLALQMGLFIDKKINNIDIQQLKKLSVALDFPLDLDNPETLHQNTSRLLDKYGFAATKYILGKLKDFAGKRNKKILVVISDPYGVVYPILKGSATIETRYDKEIVDYLQQNDFNYFDMNLVHIADFKCFNLSVNDYWKRYFIGHYNSTGNHLFATSIAPKVIDWINPRPITYQKTDQRLIDFKGYLDMRHLEK
jgi:hypothetical protein